MRNKNRVIVYLSEELARFFEGKAAEGYKKTALIRRILSEHVRKSGLGDADGGS